VTIFAMAIAVSSWRFNSSRAESSFSGSISSSRNLSSQLFQRSSV
jgi:hypothetical protein